MGINKNPNKAIKTKLDIEKNEVYLYFPSPANAFKIKLLRPEKRYEMHIITTIFDIDEYWFPNNNIVIWWEKIDKGITKEKTWGLKKNLKI